MTIPLQRGIVYGPVNSRRLGRSLGINLLPTHLKICTFNCLYCQYGWTRIHDQDRQNRDVWPSVTEVRQEVKQALGTISSPPAYITFSGNGEPTLHPHFEQMVGEIIRLRDRYAPVAKTAILSNSSTVVSREIRDILSRLDVRIMKLDCGDDVCFQNFNRPRGGLQLGEVVQGLAALPQVTIQTLFCDGTAGNFTEKNIRSWIDRLRQISPLSVQIYTLDRGYPSKDIQPVTKDDLMAVKQQLDREKINSQVFVRE